MFILDIPSIATSGGLTIGVNAEKNEIVQGLFELKYLLAIKDPKSFTVVEVKSPVLETKCLTEFNKLSDSLFFFEA